MAVGIPTVATAIGTIFRIINDGENGFLVSTSLEWKSRIIELKESQQLRESMGRKAATTVNAFYSIHANKKIYKSIIAQVLASTALKERR